MRRALLALVVAVPVLAGTAPAASAAAAVGPLPGTWGGTVVATNGESVTVDVSTEIAQDPALQLRWADFLTTLVHGPELASVTVVIVPLQSLRGVCGGSALGCYLGSSKTLYAPADDVPGQTTARSILAHEYGHHIAGSASNSPWPAIDWGTKRWATVVGVCAGVGSGRLHPGDERQNYALNPGEAFPEAYRVLNEQLLGLPATPWSAVDLSLQPSQAALDAIRLDIQSPWTRPSLVTRSGTFSRASAAATKTFTIATPLDGSLAVSVKSARTGRYRAKTSIESVCGQRSVDVTVTRVKGYGPFTLTVSAP